MNYRDHHNDLLAELDQPGSLNQKLLIIHNSVKEFWPFIDRIAVALLDSPTQKLKTFIASSGANNPLVHYESGLEQAPSLQRIIQTGRPRVINDLNIFADGEHEHTQKIARTGYQSSYTMPVKTNDRNLGFIFFNSFRKNCFTEKVLYRLDVYGHLIKQLIVSEIRNTRTMMAALRTASQMVHYKDPETGAHLDRMSRFSRLIARELSLSNAYPFDDEFIEHIFTFAPLHDIGKIGIPDEVLLKPGRLNPDEFEVMKTHTTKGRQIIDSIIRNFDFESFEYRHIMRHITEYHHETLDGEGYPLGLPESDIPIEARIIAVADIFDALTSRRPYKDAWDNEKAFRYLKSLTRTKLDEDAVEALVRNRQTVEEIQQTFRDEEHPATAS